MAALFFAIAGRRPALTALLLVLALAGCGGGGGGSSNPPEPPPPAPPPPPPTPNSISGVVMLGPVANADVVLLGTAGELGNGQTDADGRFGPVEYASSYSGPLRIEVSGNGSSTWVCDARPGCDFAGGPFSPGDTVPFDGDLEAVLPDSSDGQFVSVSLLSDAVAKRMDVYGGLNSANVNAAGTDIALLLRTVLDGAVDAHSLTVSSGFSSIELFNPNQPPAPGGNNDALATVLSLLNSSLASLGVSTQTAGEFTAAFSQAIAAEPAIPVSATEAQTVSIERLASAYLAQIQDINQAADAALVAALDALLAPGTFSELHDAAVATNDALPSLIIQRVSGDSPVFVFDSSLQFPIQRQLGIVASDGAVLRAGDLDATALPGTGGDWLTASVDSFNGQVFLQLDFDNQHIATLANGRYFAPVAVFSRNGEHTRDTASIELSVNLTARAADAGPDVGAPERTTVALQGSVRGAGTVQRVSWTQSSGPPVVFDDPGILASAVTLPSIASDADVTLRLTVEFDTGDVVTDSMTINVIAFPQIADQVFPDTALQQCVTDTAASGGLVEVPELTALNCTGVANLGGLDVLSALATLSLPANSLSSLQPLLALENLQFLDIAGTPGLRCNEIDELAARLEEGVDLLVNDLCQGNVDIDLAASGHDTALDTARGQIYVSLPDRNQIAVISTTDLRIVDRIALAGSPYGIDLSLDGTRLFAALFGSSAVAVIDMDQRTVATIPLADTTGHSSIYDVVEGAPDRLFVTASPSSGGFAYVAQVRLDQGNLASRVAGGRIIRARPTLARSPDQGAVYVGEGFSPNSLYKLNLLDPAAPIVLEDDHGAVSGTSNLVLNAEGTRISLRSGQVLRTGSFIEEGRVTPGVSATDATGNTLFVSSGGNVVEAFDFNSLQAGTATTTSCSADATTRITPYGNDLSFMLLQGDTACLYTELSRSTPPDPFAALRFTDLGLEECVIDAANTNGFTLPQEFLVLDCSTANRNILGVDGIDRLANLEQLDLSNSSVFDLSAIAALTSLQSLAVRDAGLTDISPLLGMASLITADLTGNPQVLCSDIDTLVAGGVAVQADECTVTDRLELGGIGGDIAFDAAGNRVFVSVPSLQQIVEIDLATSTIAQSFAIGAEPRGINLAADGQTLYVALYNVGDMAVLDTASAALEIIDISTELGDDRTWDIAEVSADRVLVSSNPGSAGLAYIVEVRRDLGNAATRVASNRVIRAGPAITVSADSQAVYVGEGFSPNSLYKLDASQATLPIVLEDDHGAVSGTDSLALSPDGSRIYLRSGQVLDTSTLLQVAQFPSGRSTVSADGSKLFVGNTGEDAAWVFDTVSGSQSGSRSWGCDLLSLTALEEYGIGILALGDDLLCYGRVVSYL